MNYQEPSVTLFTIGNSAGDTAAQMLTSENIRFSKSTDYTHPEPMVSVGGNTFVSLPTIWENISTIRELSKSTKTTRKRVV